MAEKKVALPERGEVLVEWDDRCEVVSLSMRKVQELDHSLPGAESPKGGGLKATMALESVDYTIDMCLAILGAAFDSSGVVYTEDDLQNLYAEIGMWDLQALCTAILRFAALGKKRLRALVEQTKKTAEEAQSTSPGVDTSASPLASST